MVKTIKTVQTKYANKTFKFELEFKSQDHM